VETPKYTVGQRPKRKLTEDVEHRIQEMIDENEEKRRKGQHKHVTKAADFYETLAAENVDIRSDAPLHRCARQRRYTSLLLMPSSPDVHIRASTVRGLHLSYTLPG